MMKYAFFCLLSVLFTGCVSQKNIVNSNRQIPVEMIWDKAPHSAFTDLIRFKNKWYCTFREAPAHVSGPVGRALLITSVDGEKWQSIDSFEMKGMDVRDPKLSITPGNRLMVLMDVESYKDGKIGNRSPYFSVSDEKGITFSRPEKSTVDESVTTRSDWVWRVTWYNGVGYAVVYQPTGVVLLKTSDGSYFEKVSKLDVTGGPNESTIRFDKQGNMYIIIRRDGEDPMAILAKSQSPYTSWTFTKMNYRLGGPNFLFLNDKTLCIGARLYEKADGKLKPATAIFLSDLSGQIYKTIKLPSGGDTSYPGMVVFDNQLWVSYYSSHEGKTAIYLARLPLAQLDK